jgi:pimeloyl-ACP methyl ester carboxylesterase
LVSSPPSALLFDEWEIELHGHRVIYRIAGDGPPVVLIHGMVNSSKHWERVALRLADRYTVVAPDLLGHGDSAAVRGDYSLGAHACSIRDLLTTIGIDRATVVGHSLGGGIAMQFFYQFPQRVERLALISSGGLGREVSPMLRGAALPGSAAGIWLVANRRVREALDRAGERVRARGSRKGVYMQAIARAMKPLQEATARHAFIQTLRSVIDVRGQHVSAIDRLYLLGELPTLIVWGERDNTIPMAHGLAAHERIPNSRFVTLPKAAHFPNLEDPDGLAGALLDWLDTSEPGLIEDSEWGQIVGARSPRRQRFAPAEPEGSRPSPARPRGSPE